jgi:hypothetical protein
MGHTCNLSRISALVAIAALSACSEPRDSTPGLEGDPSQVFSQLVVRLNGTNPPTITRRTVTRAEQEARIRAREQRLAANSRGVVQEAITQDGTCGWQSLWLFNLGNQTGEEICFTGAGTAQLNQFPINDRIDLGEKNWSGAVVSYWAGAEAGGFWGPSQNPSSLFCGSSFTVNQRVNAADSCTQHAQQVYLSN